MNVLKIFFQDARVLLAGFAVFVGLLTGSAHAQTTQHDELTTELRQALKQNLLDKWYPRAVDDKYGGYLVRFKRGWEAAPPQRKMIVMEARHLWTTARAAGFFPNERERYLQMADHGFRFLRDAMWDEEQGGFRPLVNRKGEPIEGGGSAFTNYKTAYGNAFAIYGLAEYYHASRNIEALQMAQRAFRWLDKHAHDDERGGYFQVLRDDGTPYSEGIEGTPPKDQNSTIHVLEAFTRLYEVWPNDTLRSRLQEQLDLLQNTLITDRSYLRLFFKADWTPVSYRDSSASAREAHYNLDHLSFGHDVETAYLMLEAARALGRDERPVVQQGKQMVDHALRFGWDDGIGGLYDAGYYVSPDSVTIIESGKEWWSQAEALNTLLFMAKRFPKDQHDYAAHFETLWTYTQRYLLDDRYGGWYRGGLDEQPDLVDALKGSMWKGAYHTSRALMHLIDRLEGRDW